MLSEKWRSKIDRVKIPVLACIIGAAIFSIPPLLISQSPLTVQPSTSRVGVNNTTPGYALDVAGTINATAFRGDGSQLTNLSGASSQWTTNGANIYYNTGNVGFNNTTPGDRIDVSGNINLSGVYKVGGVNGDTVTISNIPTSLGCGGYTFVNGLTFVGGILVSHTTAETGECQ